MSKELKLGMTMTACNRPNYLKEVLDSLSKNAGIEKYTLHFGVEPINVDVCIVCNEVSFIKKEVTVNQKVLGVRNNPYETLERAFKKGYDAVLYLEDDVLLTTDTVNLADWYFKYEKANDYLCLNLYNHDSSATGDPKAVIAGDKFSALGIGITRHQWYTHFKPNWYVHPSGWDFCFTDLVNQGLKVLQPEISRSHHIGRFGGTYYRAHMHDDMYAYNPMYKGTPITDFFVK